jgi:N-acyl-D-amino-acid deacylase
MNYLLQKERMPGYIQCRLRYKLKDGMHKNIKIVLLLAICLVPVFSCSLHPVEVMSQDASSSWLVKNALIYDGTGSDPYRGDIRIKAGVIIEIGALSASSGSSAMEGEKIWDARGMALSPGFIDPHSHHDSSLMEQPAPASLLAQGITTIISGLDGSSSKFGDSYVSIADNMAHFEKNPAAINLGYFGPHNNYRSQVMGADYKRPATDAEVDLMGKLLMSDLDAGALGLSTGLEYEPAIYSASSEVITLARIAAEAGGKYSSHIRSEDVDVTAAFEEVFAVAREAKIPANISHIKLAMYELYGSSTEFIHKLDSAREEGLNITADIYPYDGWQSTLSILIPSRDYYDRTAAEYALTSIAAPSTIIFAHYEGRPEYVGKTLEEIAIEENVDPVDLLMELLQKAEKEDLHESIIGRNIGEQDIVNFMKWSFTSITTDGSIDGRHPRGQGSFARVLARYVRENEVLSLSEAIRKMTSLTASNLGLSHRGEIKQGFAADIVVFDPDTIADHATFEDPLQYSTGVRAVWVNGELVWENSEETGARPGQIVRRD